MTRSPSANPASSPPAAHDAAGKRRPRTLDAAVEPYDLPIELAALARAVARRTRLLRREQAMIAAELAAVIRGHLDAGAAPAQIPALLGELDDVAMRQRRAQLAKRLFIASCVGSCMDCLREVLATLGSRRRLLLVVLVPVLLYAALLIRFEIGTPEIARNFSAEFNAPYIGLSPGDRAETVYAEAHRLLGHVPQEQHQTITAWLALRPEDEDWPTAAQYIRDVEAALDMIRRAAAMPIFGHLVSDSTLGSPWLPDQSAPAAPASVNPRLIKVNLPYLAPMRMCADLLAIHALEAAERGEGGACKDDILAMLGIVGHVREHPFFINHLVALNVLRRAAGRLGLVLELHPGVLTDEQLGGLGAAFAAFGDDELQLRLQGERAFFADIVQRSYTDNGRGNGRITPEGLRIIRSFTENMEASSLTLGDHIAGPFTMLRMPSRRTLVNEWERIAGMIETGAWQAAEGAWYGMNADRRLGYELVYNLMPAFGRASREMADARLARDAVLTVIALERFRLARDEYPATLDELAPEFLTAVPIDPWDLKPLKYIIVDGRPQLYSAGEDGTDDGGVFEVEAEGSLGRPAMPDRPLWPVPR